MVYVCAECKREFPFHGPESFLSDAILCEPCWMFILTCRAKYDRARELRLLPISTIAKRWNEDAILANQKAERKACATGWISVDEWNRDRQPTCIGVDLAKFRDQ